VEAHLLTGLIGLVALIVLIAIRMPIAYSMILVGGIGTSILNGPDIFLAQLKNLAYSQFSIYDLSVVPMFVLMGSIATQAGLSRDLFTAANGAVCGSSLATASTMGQVALPELRRYHYKDALATGTLAAGGVLGILIPPSVVLVIYAIIVEANIITMFMAAMLPGILAVIMFLITIALYVALFPESGPKGRAVARGEFIKATLRVLPVVAIFGTVIGGIYAGLFDPTPAAAVGVVLVGIYGVARGAVRWPEFKHSLLETARTTGMIYLILLGAEMLKIFMARGGVPQAMAEWMVGSGLSAMSILVILLVALIFLGCLMDSLSMILLAIPFFWPVLVAINGGDGVSAANAAFGMTAEDLKIWFGILALIVVEVGLITPPVGMNVFVISAMVPDVPMGKIFLGVMPFFVSEMIRVTILVMFPVITLWLPKLLNG
jgi:tripartite ATP-independent transporter DctM subunit